MIVRLMDYLSKHSILTAVKYGFRPNYSTDIAVYHICQNIFNVVDDKMFHLTVFCNLTEAFDTISLSILLEKL